MLKLQMFILCDCNLYHCTVTKCASCASCTWLVKWLCTTWCYFLPLHILSEQFKAIVVYTH